MIVPGLLTLILLGMGLLQPEFLAALTQTMNQFVFGSFKDLYIWFAFATLILFPAIAISPLGSLRLGGPQARPEHSWFSWIAMLFTCGMGIGFMLWGAAEPLYHYINPPISGLESSAQREASAFAYSFLHWGLEPWAIYGMTAIILGFVGFNLKRGFRLGSILEDGQEESFTRKQWPRFILAGILDNIMIIAIIFGVASTLAQGVLNVEGGLNAILGWAESIPTELIIMAVLTSIYLISAARGLDQGLKVLSNISVVLSFLLVGALLFLGPSDRIFYAIIHDVPGYLGKLFPLSLAQGNFQDPTWLNQWTIKYWSWWIGWAPFVGLFIAIISRGRTIREILIAVLVIPALYSLLWFSVLGESAISLQKTTEVVGDTFDWDQVTGLLFDMLTYYFASPLLAWLGIILIGIFVCNSADSASFIMACFTQQNVKQEGKTWIQLVWGSIFAILTTVLLIIGNTAEFDALFILQQITQITALPFTFALIGVFAAVLWQMVRYRWQTRAKPVS